MLAHRASSLGYQTKKTEPQPLHGTPLLRLDEVVGGAWAGEEMLRLKNALQANHTNASNEH